VFYLCNFCFIFIILLNMCSRLTVKSKSSGSSHTHTHAHIRTHTNTQTPYTHSLTVRRGVHELAPARTGSVLRCIVYTRTMTASGAVDYLPVPMGGVGRGWSRVRALAHIHTHTLAAIAPARGTDIVSWVALTSVRATRNAARDWSGPPRSVQRLS